MVLILSAIILMAGGILVIKKAFKSKEAYQALVECTILAIAILVSMTLIIIGVTGVCSGESEINLVETHGLVGIKQGNSTYVFLDDENTCYYVNGDRVIIINNNSQDTNAHCEFVDSTDDKFYIEKYTIDYKMNFWTFALADGVEYRIYVPNE